MLLNTTEINNKWNDLTVRHMIGYPLLKTNVQNITYVKLDSYSDGKPRVL